MALTIEMTLRGVLLACGWRTAEELNNTTTENKRNTLIVEMSTHSNQSVSYFQGLNDHELIGKGATVVFLRDAGIRDDAALRHLSTDDQRNTLIVVNNGHTDRPIRELQGLSNQELVQIGLEWFAKSRTVAAILEFFWNIDFAKVAGTKPEIIATEDYDNRGSSVPLKDKFVIAKEVSNTSTFSEEHGFTVKVGVETTFKAGIPKLAENETTVKLDASTTNTWKLGEENTTKQSYSRESDVEVPPHLAI